MASRRILLVEDRPADVRLTLRALKKAGYDEVPVDVAEHGRKAVEFLRKESPHEQAERPDLILLDWMMPIMNGEEVLEEIRKDPNLRCIPVVILTTSRSDIDISRAYEMGCNAYLTKPVDPAAFQKAIESMGSFWLETAVLPKP